MSLHKGTVSNCYSYVAILETIKLCAKNMRSGSV